MKKGILAGVAMTIAPVIAAPAFADDAVVYGTFPVTLQNWVGTETNSVAYTGQIARQVLHDSLKNLRAKVTESLMPP